MIDLDNKFVRKHSNHYQPCLFQKAREMRFALAQFVTYLKKNLTAKYTKNLFLGVIFGKRSFAIKRNFKERKSYFRENVK